LGETKPAVEARPRIAIRIVNAIRDESGSGPGGGPSASGSCPLTGTDPADDSVRPGHWRIRLAPAVRNAAFRPPAPGGAAFGSPSGAGCDAQPARAPRSAAFGSVRPCGVRRPARPGRGAATQAAASRGRRRAPEPPPRAPVLAPAGGAPGRLIESRGGVRFLLFRDETGACSSGG